MTIYSQQKKETFWRQRWLPLIILSIGAALCLTLIILTDRPLPIDKRESLTAPSTKLYDEEGENLFALMEQDISAQEVIIHDNGKTYSLYVSSGTIGDAIEKSGIELGEFDELSISNDAQIHAGMEISITRVTVQEYHEFVEEPYETVMQASPFLLGGVEKLLQTGVEGQRRYTYETIFRNGVASDNVLVGTEVTVKPVNEIIAYGTETYYRPDISCTVDDEAKTITLSDGLCFKYTDTIRVSATAYTTENMKNKITYSGATATYGIIAVDPKVIPLGTELFVTSTDGTWVYGYAIAGDIGGKINNKCVDLFYDTRKECITFGRQPAYVYILG